MNVGSVFARPRAHFEPTISTQIQTKGHVRVVELSCHFINELGYKNEFETSFLSYLL